MTFCTYCGRQFARQEHLERHILIHTNVKPFVCLQCNKPFTRRDALKRHYETHQDRSTLSSPGRTQTACSNCARSKTKCDRQSPCGRCASRGVECVMERPQLNVSIPANASKVVPPSPPLTPPLQYSYNPQQQNLGWTATQYTYTDNIGYAVPRNHQYPVQASQSMMWNIQQQASPNRNGRMAC